jgi:hypothetical protein
MKNFIAALLLFASSAFAQGQLSPMPHLQFLTNTGTVCASCTISTYAAGTATPQATYSDYAITIANPTVIGLNSAGRPSVSGVEVAIYLDSSKGYKFVLKTSLGATIWTQDNIKSLDTLLSINLADPNSPNGPYLIGYKQNSGPARTVGNVLNEFPTLQGAGGDNTGSADASADLAAGCSANRMLFVGDGTYLIADDVTADCTLVFIGGILNTAPGKTLTINSTPIAGDAQIFSGSGSVVVPNPRAKWFGSSTQQVVAPGAPNTATGASGVLTGTYYYSITFVNPVGETEAGTTSSSVAPSSQKVDLTNIPISADLSVTARNIYRTLATPADNTIKYLVTTISDNTTTTYSDNVSDGSLGALRPVTNTTGGALSYDGFKYQIFSPAGFLSGYNISPNSSTSALLYGKFNATAANQKLTVNGSVNILTVPEYTDNSAALSAGLKVGDIYRTADAVKIVH